MHTFLLTFRRGFAPLLLLLLGLARLAGAQAPAFDMALNCGTLQSAAGFLYVNAFTTDSQGNTLVTGNLYGTISFGSTVLTSSDGDVFVAKRTAAGDWLWAVSGGGSWYDGGTSIAVDALGQVYVTGSFGSDSGKAYAAATFGSTTLTSTGGRDVLVAKLDGRTGQWLWATSAGAGTANGTDEIGTALAADAQGGLLLVGTFADFRLRAGPLTLYQVGTGTNLFVARLDAATGAWTWATNPGPVTPNYLAVDSQGSGYVSGSFTSASLTLGALTLTNPRVSTYSSQGFVAKFNAAGTWQWATALDATPGGGTNTGASSGGAYGFDLAVDGQDHLYLCGVFRGASATFGATVLPNASTTYQGEQIGTIQLGDAFVARLSASTGAWQWAVRAGGADAEYFNRLAVHNGRVFVSGIFGRSNTMFEPGTPSPAGSDFGGTTLVSAGRYDIVVAGLSDTGTWQWALRAGGAGLDNVSGLTVDASGRVQLLSACEAPAQFGPFPVAKGYNILARLAGGVLASSAVSAATPFALYPNPAHTIVTLSGLPASQPVQVLDVLGRLVLTARTPAQGPLHLPLPPGLAAGVYVVRAGHQARQLLVE